MRLVPVATVLAASAASFVFAQEPATYVDQAKVAEVLSKGGRLSAGSDYAASGARRQGKSRFTKKKLTSF